MTHVMSPHIERVRDAFVVEYAGKGAAAVGGFICALSGEDDDGARAAQARQVVIVVEVRKILRRVVEV